MISDHENKNKPFYSIQITYLNHTSLKRHTKLEPRNLKKLAKFFLSDTFNDLKSHKQKKESNITITIDDIEKIEKRTSYDLIDESEITIPINEELEDKNNEGWNRWNEIVPGILLGAIPDDSFIDEIENYAKTNFPTKPLCIVTMLDEFEMAVKRKIQLPEYKKRGMLHQYLPMTDFGGGGTTKESILSLVYFMRQVIEQNGSLYLHCKAGRARSALALVVYLAIYHFRGDLKAAVSFLKSKRKQVDLHDEKVPNDQSAWDKLDSLKIEGIGKLEIAHQAIKYHQELMSEQVDLSHIEIANDNIKIKKTYLNYTENLPIEAFNHESSKPSVENNIPHGTTPLSTLAFKNYVIQLESFKYLKIQATFFEEKSQRAIYMRQFLDQFLYATDDKWFTDRHIDNNNAIYNLFYNSKTPGEFKKIINEFCDDILAYRAQFKDDNALFAKDLGKIKEYFKNLHSASFLATHIKIKKRSLEMTWDDFNIKLEAFLKAPAYDIACTNLLESLINLEEKIEKRINQEKSKIRIIDNTAFLKNFDNYKLHIDNMKTHIVRIHKEHKEGIKFDEDDCSNENIINFKKL